MVETILFVGVEVFSFFVSSIVGFGSALIAMPLLLLFMEPKVAVCSHIMVGLPINALLVCESRRHLEWGKVKFLLMGGIAGIPIGAYSLASFETDVIRVIIFLVTLIFGAIFLLNFQIRMSQKGIVQIFVGFLSGLLGGSTSQGGPPVVIYGVGSRWKKDVFRTTLLAYFLSLSLVAVVSYLWLSLVDKQVFWLWVCGTLPAILAGLIGIKIKNVLADGVFRKIVLFVIMGVALVGLLDALYRGYGV